MKKYFKKNAGVSLVEVLVALAISVFVFAAATRGFKAITSKLNSTHDQIAETVQSMAGSHLLLQDFRSSGASLNLVLNTYTEKVGTKSCQPNFFDYSPNQSCENLTSNDPCERICSRRIVLSVTPGPVPKDKEPLRDFFMLVDQGQTEGFSVSFTPASLFQTPKVLNEALKFKADGLNQVVEAAQEKLSGSNSSIKVWQDQSLALVESMQSFQQNNGYSKKLQFLGMVQNNAMVSTSFHSEFNPRMKTTHSPMMTVGASNLQNFLLNLPLEAGVQPWLTFKTVKFVKLSLRDKPYKNRPAKELVRWVWNPGETNPQKKWTQEQVLAHPIESLEIFRPSISSPGMQFKITSPKSKEPS